MGVHKLGGYAAIAALCIFIGPIALTNPYHRCFAGVRAFEKVMAIAKASLAEFAAVICLLGIVSHILILIVFFSSS
jgi:hypothetical protein